MGSPVDENEGVQGLSSKRRERNAINAEVYEDDSSSDESGGESSQVKAKDQKQASDDGSADDMFASGDEGGTEAKPIEESDSEERLLGRALERTTGAINEDEDTENESDEGTSVHDQVKYFSNIETLDEESMKKMKSTNMKVKLEAFNLDKESKTGEIDEEGNYTHKNGSDSDEEPWMNDWDKTQIRQAKLAKAKEEKNLTAEKPQPLEEVLGRIIELLEPAETPMEALQQLNLTKAKRTLEKRDRKERIYLITELCDQLMSKGFNEAYDMSREDFMRQYKTECGVEFTQGTKRKLEDEDHDDAYYNDKRWLYRWKDETEVHGPFTSYEMQYWVENYFEGNVQVSEIGQKTFREVNDVTFG